MSDMKCPFCNTSLEVLVGGANALLGCPRCRYKATDGVWQELIRTKELLEIEDAEHSMCHTQMLKTTEKLERTRKALDVAVRAIQTIKYSKKSDAINLRHKANKALIEIYKIKDQTALEQKDIK